MSNYKNILKNISNINIKDTKIAFISADFNKEYVQQLSNKTKSYLNEKKFSSIDKYNVPGALEIPAMLKRILDKKKYDLIFCFGVVIRGDTTHYDLVCNETARGISDLSLFYTDTAIIMGLLTCENKKQVEERINENLAISALNLLSEIKKLG